MNKLVHLLFLISYFHCFNAKVISVTKKIGNEGIIRYHYHRDDDDDVPLSSSKSFLSEQNKTIENSNDKKCAYNNKILILGVGTSMSVSDYDLTAKEIVLASLDSSSSSINSKTTSSSSKTIIPIIIDPEPDWMFKTNFKRFAHLANTIVDEIMSGNILPPSILRTICDEHRNRDDDDDDGNNSIIRQASSLPESTKNNNDSNLPILVGGHSAGGQAAFESLSLLKFKVKGFFGLDPYEFDVTNARRNNNRPQQQEKLVLQLPSLYWGFTETTCGVQIDKAAKAGYEISNRNRRILYLIQNDDDSSKSSNNSTNTNQTYYVRPHHCIFTDNGCSFICPKSISKVQQTRILRMIGQSSNRFFQAIIHDDGNSFSRKDFDIDNSTQYPMIQLFVNQDEVMKVHNNNDDTKVPY